VDGDGVDVKTLGSTALFLIENRGGDGGSWKMRRIAEVNLVVSGECSLGVL